ncbi:avidin-like [Paroedura picta]|uniref:avidin-like n=1 Tax=Paroedura picta TaxID=143630 RepID=UPI00405646BB
MERLSLQPASALLAALLLASAAADAPPPTVPQSDGPKTCTLAGMWVNDLGSRMVISPANEAGAFSGSYLTAVTASNEAIVESPLLGAQHHPDQRAQPTFSFLVLWKFTATTTAFVGQCFVDEAGDETLETLWLLRKEAPTRGQDWQSTLVGKNVFTRVK